MNLYLTAQGFELTQALKNHAQEKFKWFNDFSEFVHTTAHMVLHASHGTDLPKAEVKIHTKHGEVFAHAKHSDLYHAITDCAQKAHVQITKKHSQVSSHRANATPNLNDD